MVRLGLAVSTALVGLWLLLPVRAPASEAVAGDALGCLHRALRENGSTARCREIVLAGMHRDLLGSRLPGLLRVLDGLAGVERDCDPTRGDAFARGICALRRGRTHEALSLFGEIPSERGGAAYREVAAGLWALERRHGRRGPRTP